MKKILFSDALFSKDRIYRYALWRIWDDNLPKILFIGLNPSTADEIQDDPTIRRCMGYAKDWGYGGIMVANLFAYISTDPKMLKDVDAAESTENRKHIKDMINKCKIVVCAWGNNRGAPPTYLQEITELYYIDLCKDGMTPKHPLYLNKTLKPKSYN